MRPDERELDDEIRSNLAIDIKERIARGEDPASARRAALQDLGYVPALREEMRRVWYSRWYDAAEALARDVRFAVRSLGRAKALTVTVVVTLALGIGANAAVFSVVRSVLLRPLVNREADRLIYIRQTADGLGIPNLTFSVPEISDFKSRASMVAAFGDFSTVNFTMLGFGREPRLVRAGVVNGAFFEVMGLRPVLGRLLNATDDGPGAAGAAVLTHRFWKDVLNSDLAVVGQSIRLGGLTATVTGVLEPSVPYPTETEIIANMVTSPHHLGATMNTDRRHRMTDLFARLAPGATVESARAELTGLHQSMLREHPDQYSKEARIGLQVRTLQEQIASPARTILLVLMTAAAVVFIIACSNVANLILARSVRREGELAVRAALGAGRGALRRTLLAESLVLCAAGAGLGLLLAGPLVGVAGRYASRFSIRALESTVDAGVLWLGAALAVVAAVLLAYIPRLPSAERSGGLGLAGGSVRITPGTNRRLRLFATTQLACTFVLLAAAAMLVTTLTALQTANTGYDLRQVLAIDLPGILGPGVPDPQRRNVLREMARKVGELPGVQRVALGGSVPFRDRSATRMQFVAEGYQPANGEDSPTGQLRSVTPEYFSVLGVPLLAGRDFTDEDSRSGENVCIVNESVARRLFQDGDAINRRLTPTNLGTNLGNAPPARIVGIIADVDEENVVQEPSMIVYYPLGGGGGSRMFVRANGDPRALIPSVTQTIRGVAADQAVERPAVLEDIRAEVLGPERLNAFVFSALGGIALLISIVGVAGVLAFSVSARMREFGVRLAIGSTPGSLRAGVLWDGLRIAAVGIAAGACGGLALVRVG
ncbi:MAG TPA: ABC transporter permease, partial [Vicinamibacterales bacterium]|nr:ABC transporter permease [Vicinamibacterales bacterium]